MDADNITQINVKEIIRQKSETLEKRIPNFLINYVARTIHQDEINDVIRRFHDKYGVDFMNCLLKDFDLTINIINEEKLPADGRYIFASNHPLGGMDGICISTVIGNKYGGKIKYLVNDILCHLKNLQTIFVPINKHGSQARRNAELIEEAYASDNQIVTFPAGLCSRKQNGRIQDLQWQKSFIQKAKQYERDIVPIYFEGKNSQFFYNLAYYRKKLGIKANLEMLYLPDEMFSSKHSTYNIYIGDPIPWQSLDNSKKPIQWAEIVREKVYKLKQAK